MKRLFNILVLALVLAGGFSFTSSSPVLAADKQTQQQANKCRQQFNGNSYADGDAKLQNLLKDNACFKKAGNCLAKNTTVRALKVTCTQKPGTNEAHFEEAEHNAQVAENELNKKNGSTADGYTDPAAKNTTCDRNNCDIIDNFINPFIRLLSVLVGIAVVVGIVFGAVQVSMSAGDPQKSASGKNHIRNALIAMVAYVLLFIILNWLVPGGVL